MKGLCDYGRVIMQVRIHLYYVFIVSLFISVVIPLKCVKFGGYPYRNLVAISAYQWIFTVLPSHPASSLVPYTRSPVPDAQKHNIPNTSSQSGPVEV